MSLEIIKQVLQTAFCAPEHANKFLDSLRKLELTKKLEFVEQRLYDFIESPSLNPLIASYFKDINTTGTKPPFSNFEADPSNVSQIKKLFNALYYGLLASREIDVKKIQNITQTTQEISGALFASSALIDNTYEACRLATHLDIDIREVFEDEIALLYSGKAQVETLYEAVKAPPQYAEKEVAASIDYHRLGEITGIAMDELQPIEGAHDFKFLTEVGAVLPSYIDKISQVVKRYSAQLIQREPTLKPRELVELEKLSIELLTRVEGFNSNTLHVSKIYNYCMILYEINQIAQKCLEQVTNLNESSQDVLRDCLAALKYNHIPRLLSIIDKLEVNCMQKPGTFSLPVVNKLSSFYDYLLSYAQKIVNFKARGEELIKLEDSRFLARRMESTYQRIDDAEKSLVKLSSMKRAAQQFFERLTTLDSAGIQSLPPEMQKELQGFYLVIRPLVAKLNPLYDEQISSCLLGQTKATTLYYLTTPLQWLGFSSPKNEIKFLLQFKEQIDVSIQKQFSTQEFYIKLNQVLIDSVQKETPLELFPYNEAGGVIVQEELDRIHLHELPKVVVTNTKEINEQEIIKGLVQTDSKVQFKTDDGKTIVSNPNDLETDETIVLYQWYKQQEDALNQASEAYSQFIALLSAKLATEADKSKQGAILQLLPEKTLEKFSALYNKFQPYLTANTSKHLESLVKKVDDFFSGKDKAKIISLVDFEATIPLMLEYFQKYQAFLSHSTQFYLKYAGKKLAKEEENVFLVDESRMLRIWNFQTDKVELIRGASQTHKQRQEQLAKLQYAKEVYGKVVTNTNALTAEHALNLSQWYEHKRNKLKDARNAYFEFVQLLTNQSSSKDLVLGLKQLSQEQKKVCHNLYSRFQTYLINALPEATQKDFLELDRELVYFLNDKKDKRDIVSKMPLFGTLDSHFQTFFSKVDLEWQVKGQFYKKLTLDKWTAANQSEVMLPSEVHPRASYLLKAQYFSLRVHQLRDSLFVWGSSFNEPMRQELTLSDNTNNTERKGTSTFFDTWRAWTDQWHLRLVNNVVGELLDTPPYPELEDEAKNRSQCSQAKAIKQVFNSLYYLEKAAVKLESLDDKSSKRVYVTEFVLALKHIASIKTLLESMVQNPHYAAFANQILGQVKDVWSSIMENIEGYQVDALDVPVAKPITNTALWYSLNAFFISPLHIRSLSNSKPLDEADLTAIQIKAKRSQLLIEQLIFDYSNSSSTFSFALKAFMMSPQIYKLHQDLISKLGEFLASVNESTTQKVDVFHEHIFTPMLLEADKWEDEMGLEPGLITTPLKKIIDEYFTGLLHPLKLGSKQYIAIACSPNPTETRLEALTKKCKDNEVALKSLDKYYSDITALYQLIRATKLPKESNDKTHLVELSRAYKQALPKITLKKREMGFIPDDNYDPNEQTIDELLNEGLKEYDPHEKQIRPLISAIYDNYQGERNTLLMSEQSGRVKLAYLQGLKIQEPAYERDLRLQYAKDAIVIKLNEFTTRHVGLQYMDKEYNEELKVYLQKFEDAIIKESAEDKEDIDKAVSQKLTKKIQEFEQNNAELYFQLDAMKLSLSQFKNYFNDASTALENEASLFESKSTLDKKSKEIQRLSAIADNQTLSVEQRITKIKTAVVGNRRFEQIILDHDRYDKSIVKWLKRLVLSFLNVLGLYKPEKDACMARLKKAAEEPQKLSELSRHHGLFSKEKKITELRDDEKKELDKEMGLPEPKPAPGI